MRATILKKNYGRNYLKYTQVSVLSVNRHYNFPRFGIWMPLTTKNKYLPTFFTSLKYSDIRVGISLSNKHIQLTLEDSYVTYRQLLFTRKHICLLTIRECAGQRQTRMMSLYKTDCASS